LRGSRRRRSGGSVRTPPRRFGCRWKPFLVGGTLLVVAGLGLLGLSRHDTPYGQPTVGMTPEALGLICRLPDPDGERRVTAVREVRRERLRDHLATWPEDDVRMLATLLGRFNHPDRRARRGARRTSTTDAEDRAQVCSRISHGVPYSTSLSRNGTASNASGPSTPAPCHTPPASSSRAMTGLTAVCQTTA